VVPDEDEPILADLAQVHDDHRVDGQVHDLLSSCSQVNQLRPVEVTDENGVLEAFSMGLHQLADSPQPSGFADVICHQIAPPPCLHLVTIAVRLIHGV